MILLNITVYYWFLNYLKFIDIYTTIFHLTHNNKKCLIILFLGPSLKMKRNEIYKIYRREIESFYWKGFDFHSTFMINQSYKKEIQVFYVEHPWIPNNFQLLNLKLKA